MAFKFARLRTLLLTGISACLLAGFDVTGQTPGATQLVADLGCAACHSDLAIPTTLRERTPDLSDAGLRYQSGYLFDFLLNPVKERRHLGRARMPNFHLSEKEAAALTLFLGEQRRPAPREGWPELPAALQSPPVTAVQTQTTREIQEVIASGNLLCLNCHTLDGQGGLLGLELNRVGHRLQADWVQEYLVAPERFGSSPALMPSQFFQRTPDGKQYHELTGDASGKIRRITAALFSLDPAPRLAQEKRWAEVRVAHPEADVRLGETLFRAFQCGACHRLDSVVPMAPASAPRLTGLGHRVHSSWLTGYLKSPTPIRPFGFEPGTGSRMPDFQLSEEETELLGTYLISLKDDSVVATNGYALNRISTFSRRKARLLMQDKLACLGCHQWGNEGGRIGPDLTRAHERLQPAYVYQMIKDPGSVHPHTVMPRSPLPEATVRLLAGFLSGKSEITAAPPVYLSPADHSVIPMAPAVPAGSVEGRGERARRNYLKYCASCHGNEGRGDGFNAAYLPVKPTVHADGNYMATRPDDTLYDGIHAGGYILNRSPRMPAWGGTLSREEIRELVVYLRRLCECEGPAWSRDGVLSENSDESVFMRLFDNSSKAARPVDCGIGW